MADTAVAITAGTGTNIDTRTEATNGNHRQVVVLGDPATNAGVAPVDATAGLKVDLGADNDITGTVTANLGATDNAVLDDIAAKLGTIDADTSTLAAAVSTEVQVDVVGALPAGTNAIGKLAANSGVDIGDVDVTSIIPGVGATNLGKAIDTATGATDTGVLALATRDDALSALTPIEGDNVQLRTNSTGALWVIPSGTTTVDGSGVTQPVSNAGLTELAAAINSSKVDVNIVSSDVATGGTSAADDADFTAGTTPGTPAMGIYESTPTSVTDGDLGTIGITTGRRMKTSATIDAALPAGTNNIGDVDVLSSALPTGASTSAKQDTVIGHLDGVETLLGTIDADTSNLSVVGGGTEAAAIRVTIANNSTGVLSVDDNGGALTVDGTVTVGNPEAIGGGTQYAVDAALGATPTGTLGVAIRDDALSALTPVEGDAIGMRVDANGALWTHDDALDAAISGSELQVDVVASLPAGTNNIGDVDIASIAAGDNNIGNVDIVTMPTVTVNSHAVTNAGTFATQATLQAGTAYAGKVRLTDGTTDTDIRDLANSNALNVAMVDGSGDQIVSFGGGTEYTEDVATANPIVGKAIMIERDDALTAVTPIEGDNIGLRGTAEGALWTQDFNSDAILSDTTAIKTAVEVLDNAISGNEMQVDVLTMPTTAVTNAGLTELAAAINASSQMDVNIAASNATITVASHAVTNAGTFATQVDGAALTALQLIDDTVATLGTTTYTEAATKGNIIGAVRRDADTTLVDTTNEVGPLQMNAAGQLKVEVFSGEALPVTMTSTTVTGTVAVTQSGTWDEVGINDSGNSITVDNAQLSVVGSGTEATAMRVTLATDSTGVLSVDDNGGALTVDNAGTFATQVNGDALTALQLIDNSIYVDDADWTADTSSHTLVGAVTQVVATANTDGDTTPLTTNAFRELRVAIPESDLATATTKHVKKYYTNAGAVTDGIIWSPAAGTRWYVTDIYIQVSAAATVTLEDDLAAGDAAIWKGELAANSGWDHSFKTPWYSGEDAADLLITTTAGNVYVTVVGYEI